MTTRIQLAGLGDAEPIATLSNRLIENGLPWSWTDDRVRHHIRSASSTVLEAPGTSSNRPIAELPPPEIATTTLPGASWICRMNRSKGPTEGDMASGYLCSGCHAHACVGMFLGLRPACPRRAWSWHPT